MTSIFINLEDIKVNWRFPANVRYFSRASNHLPRNIFLRVSHNFYFEKFAFVSMQLDLGKLRSFAFKTTKALHISPEVFSISFRSWVYGSSHLLIFSAGAHLSLFFQNYAFFHFQLLTLHQCNFSCYHQIKLTLWQTISIPIYLILFVCVCASFICFIIQTHFHNRL